MKRAALRTASFLISNPTTTSGVLLFAVAFVLVMTNAVYFQTKNHPAPLWNTAQTDDALTQVEQLPVRTTAIKGLNPVLAQPISLRNVPVPTARATIKKSPANRSSLVRELQTALSEFGFYKGKIDGISGSGTRQAIMDYQTKAGMLPDGVASYKLLERINMTLALAKERANKETSTKVTKVISEATKVIQEKSEAAVKSDEPKSYLDKAEKIVFDKETVTRIQTGLKEVFGENEIDVDGLYGDQTRQAVMRFQEFFNITATGEIDHRTMEKLLSTGVISAI